MNYRLVLNLSEGFVPLGGTSPNRLFAFPGGEQHVDVSNIKGKSCLITIRLMNSDHIMQALLAADALKRNGVKKIGLFAPYIPYARQDRVAAPGDPLSIRVMASLINSAGFADVYVLDAHSPVTLALINNVRELDWQGWAKDAFMEQQEKFNTGRDSIIVAPDAGAAKKIERLAHDTITDFMCLRKERDALSGELNVFTPVFVHDMDITVVDDICDGGATFIQIAKQFADAGNSLHLIVTHGIFSRGLGPLYAAGYQSIHTSDSWGNGVGQNLYVHGVPTEVAK